MYWPNSNTNNKTYFINDTHLHKILQTVAWKYSAYQFWTVSSKDNPCFGTLITGRAFTYIYVPDDLLSKFLRRSCVVVRYQFLLESQPYYC